MTLCPASRATTRPSLFPTEAVFPPKPRFLHRGRYHWSAVLLAWRNLTLAAALLAACAGPSAAQSGLPSGQAIVLWEVVWERVDSTGTQAILRFIAPGIAREVGTVDVDAAFADLDWLCATHAVPIASLPASHGDTVVITLMDRPVPRGETDPEATQYFGIYTIENGECSPSDF
ncbi:hypothetical protein SAMN05444004_11938 [Jannaschia faecimaris]|uniref:Uncharacterized protein n=1 Tax=Jannaschia faecimaris TaxID=1244108 RepID=A0A1H3TR98_9RHOB|nr:DUF6497 family protein [Jannaschia faecimaris]SDZ52792.1 hypothetical protein SAMN05444004_11938 [Jannaschia faecimaris]